MPLDFVDFAHHYEGSGLEVDAQRQQFEVFADLMECLFRAICREAPAQNSLGIRLNGDVLALTDALKSQSATQRIFNHAASGDAARKIAP